MGSDNKSIIKPLEHPVNAMQHTPVYKMHRYYARRPWNVFEHIIKHYTDEGDIILDPFCGGGVTVVESLKLKRKVIGVDLNPLATFITRMEVEPVDLDEFKIVFDDLVNIVSDEIQEFYVTKCNKCKKVATAEWYLWSNIFECPNCKEEVVISETKKIKAGQYKCKKCKTIFKPSEAIRIGEKPINLLVNCGNCGSKKIQKISENDIEIYNEFLSNFNSIIKKKNLWYPLDKFPDGDRERDDALFQKGIKYFHQLFTKRSLLVNAILLKKILEYNCSKNIKDFLIFSFSSNLSWTSIMSSDTGHGWQHHAYWIPNEFYELNVIKSFKTRTFDGISTIKAGKIYSNYQIGNEYKKATKFEDLKDEKTCLILTQSSHDFTIPNNSVDIVITDPPFGGNVQYAELSDFWIVWLQNYLGINGIIDNKLEAIQTRHSGFETEKDDTHYEEMLYKIFKECHRVLKINGYLVMTFHNRDIKVWMSLHRAAARAGFRLPKESESETRGILYQPPIKNYTQTLHQKATGSMLGDFILTFIRMDILDDERKIKSLLSAEQEKIIEDKISEVITFHGGADENTIMTVLIPTLNELGIFRQLSTFNWLDFINKRFFKNKATNKWYTKDHFDDFNKLKAIDYIKAEEVTKTYVIGYLKDKTVATIDELLTELYTKLVNSHRPGIEAINKVLNQYCIKVKTRIKGKYGYALKPEKSVIEPSKTDITHQMDIFGGSIVLNDLSHDDIIKLLYNFASDKGFKVHAGETEQRKDPDIKSFSTDMLFKEDWGIASKKAFDKIKEIDLLVLDGREIKAAFEVTTSINTAREAINDRYRDLYAILPNTKINTYIIVYDDDYKKAFDMINSVANKRDKLSDRIKIIKKSDLTKDNFEKWIDR